MRRFVPAFVIGFMGFALARANRTEAQSWAPTREGNEPPIRIEEYGSFSDGAESDSYESRFAVDRSYDRFASAEFGAPRSRVDQAYNTGTGLPPVQLDPNCLYPMAVPPPVVYPPVAPLMQPVAPVLSYAGPSIFAGPGFYASADALYLDRYHSDFPIADFVTNFGLAQLGPLSGDNFNFDNELGPRVTIGYLLATGNAIEGTYFGTYDWNETAFAVDPITFFLHEASWTSKLHSGELNFRLALTETASGIVGFRYVRIEENFIQRVLAGGAEIGVDTVGTINDLFGFQVGGDVDLLQLNRFSISINGAAGFFLNNQRNRYQVDIAMLPSNVRVREQELASLVEAGARVRYRVVGNLYAHGGYDVIMVNGVALAAQQVPGTIVSNSIFYHGPSAGITWRR